MENKPSRSHSSLHRNDEHLRLLVDAVTEYAIYTLDLDGHVASWNTGAQRIKGYKEEEILGEFFGRFFPEDMRMAGKPESLLKQARETGLVKEQGWRIRKDGTRFFAEVALTPIYDQDSHLRGYAKVTRDISDRIAMQDLQAYSERLAESERHLRSLAGALEESKNQLDIILNGVDNAITAQDKMGKLVFANAAAARHLGYPTPEALLIAPMQEIMGRFQILDEEGNPFPTERLPARLALSGKDSDAVILRYREMATGEERWSLVKASPVFDSEGRVSMAITFFQDITALKLKELEERSAKEQLRVILEGITDAISVLDPQGRLLYLNQACATLLGYDTPETVMKLAADPKAAEAVRKNIQAFDEGGNPFPPEESPSRLALAGKQSDPVRLRFRMSAESREIHVISRAKPVFDAKGKLLLVISILHDVTELHDAELKLRQSQKMEAVGRLAGGIAHDFNNLLTAINGYSDMAFTKLSQGDYDLKEEISEIRRAGERAASLTQQLLAFSRKQILAPKILDLNKVLGNMDSLLRRLIGENIQLLTVLQPNLSRIKADPGQIEQIILNLAINSRDAMPEGGKLTLETLNVDLDQNYVSTHLESRQGPHVMLAVTDTGTGMDAHTKARLFEPFFTTKGPGKGTGLGLSMVFGIVKQSGGSINVYSELGKGTTFKLYFPAVEDVPASAADIGIPAQSGEGETGETILIVEDEEGVRKFAERTLTQSGFKCLVAQDAESGLEIIRNHPQPLHLLLTDVVLPGMSGKALADLAKKVRPDMHVLFMSGYTENAIVHHGVLDEGTEFLNKPFSAQTLRQKVMGTFRIR